MENNNKGQSQTNGNSKSGKMKLNFSSKKGNKPNYTKPKKDINTDK